jgi:hypothetical protein
MVISNTSAEDIKTQAVSPEFIFNTSSKKVFLSTFIRARIMPTLSMPH